MLAQVTGSSETVKPASTCATFQRNSNEKRTAADTAPGSVSSDCRTESRKPLSPTHNVSQGQNSPAKAPGNHEEGSDDDNESDALLFEYGEGRASETGSLGDSGTWSAVAGTSSATTAATNTLVSGTPAGTSSTSDADPGSWPLLGRVPGGLGGEDMVLRTLGTGHPSTGGSTEQYRGNADSNPSSCNDTARSSNILPTVSTAFHGGVAAGSRLASSRKLRSIPAVELSACSPPRSPTETAIHIRAVADPQETPGGIARSSDKRCRECSPSRSVSLLLTDPTSTWDTPAARTSPESSGPMAASHPIAKSKPLSNRSRPRSQHRESSREARVYALSPPSPPPLVLSRPIPVRPPTFHQHQDSASVYSVPGLSSSLPRFPDWAKYSPPLPRIQPETPRLSTLSYRGATLTPTREHPQGLSLGREIGSPKNRRRKWAPPLLGSPLRPDLETAALPSSLFSVSAASGSRSFEWSCVIDGCNAPADYRPADHRREGEGARDGGVWCTVHREEGAVLCEEAFCGFPGCRARPSWGYASESMADTTSATPKRCCYRHKHDG